MNETLLELLNELDELSNFIAYNALVEKGKTEKYIEGEDDG